MAPRAGLGCCQPHSVEWLSSRCGAGGADLLSDRSVERRSDYGLFGSVDWRAGVRIKVSGHPLGRAERSSSSSGAEPESESWGRAKRSFPWRLGPDLAAVSLTLSSGSAVGAAQAALTSCQTGQWSGEVTTVSLALSTGERASG